MFSRREKLRNLVMSFGLTIGFAGAAFAQETPTPSPSPMPSPTVPPAPPTTPTPMPSPSPTEEPSPTPTETVPTPSPSPVEAPKKSEAVTPPVDTQAVDNQKKSETNTVVSTYDVPLLGVSNFKQNKTSEVAINFNGELQGLKGKAYIKPNKDGSTQIKMRFDDMKMAPKDKRFVLWVVSPDKSYTKIGQVINTGPRQESEIRGETALKDFGMFVTQEDTDVAAPTGTIYAPFKAGM